MGSDPLKTTALPDGLRRPWIDRLHRIYADMDQAYAEVAAGYRFVCNGCDDNCCLTRFSHHTVLEYLDLCEGLGQLAPEARRRVAAEARQNVADTAAGRRRPCPLLQEERCLLYAHRPMICRLHGIPHRLVRPDATVLDGEGCAAFHARCGPATRRLDRTPFYRQMSDLESGLRRSIDFSGRVNLTVAEMITLAWTDTETP